jgi:hypothetical protein
MITYFKKLLHEIAHMLCANTGEIELWWEETEPEHTLMAGFRCDTCGKLTDVHESRITKLMREARNK